MRALGEEIAVLDGLSLAPGTLPPIVTIDPSGGANYTGGSDYSPGFPLLPSSAGLAGMSAVDMDIVQQMNVLSRKSFDPSDGGNRAGGSDYSPGLPLLPSSSGLSGSSSIRADVIDASDGGNYSGGSSFAPRLPLLPSSAGLADLSAAYADLVSRWGGVLPPRTNVVDPNGGNYTGGNAYSPFVPMLPSSSGLAGLDAVPDKVLTRRVSPMHRENFVRGAGQTTLMKVQQIHRQLSLNLSRMNPENKRIAQEKLSILRDTIRRIQMIRGAAAAGALRTAPTWHLPGAAGDRLLARR
jgi:hypothetical protein